MIDDFIVKSIYTLFDEKGRIHKKNNFSRSLRQKHNERRRFSLLFQNILYSILTEKLQVKKVVSFPTVWYHIKNKNEDAWTRERFIVYWSFVVDGTFIRTTEEELHAVQRTKFRRKLERVDK